MGRYEKPLDPEQLCALKDEDIDFRDIPETDEAFWRSVEPAGAGRARRIVLWIRRSVRDFLRGSGKD